MSAKRPWAWPLVPLYAAGLAVKDGLRAAGVLRTRRLEWPVVSVGRLGGGGGGKTPVVIALAELLRERGWDVDVLSRGYGRQGDGVERVDPDGELAARRFGDEPVLLAQRLQVPVWVGADRFAAGMQAEMASQVRGVHLLDDGFQHRQLARTLDLVLVTQEDLHDALLPAGNLREPLAALRRADVVVLREEEHAAVLPRLSGLLKPGAATWTVRRTVDLPGAQDVLGNPKGLVAFCAIARPENFFQTLRRAGHRVIHVIPFPDHHFYTAADMRQLTEARQSLGGDAFITTEKDAVKITSDLRAQLAAPLLVAGLQVTFLDLNAVTRDLEARLQ